RSDVALEDLREHEPVDRAHHERIEHAPQIPQPARRVAHPQVARRQEPEGMEVAPPPGRHASVYASLLFHIDSADPIAMCMSRYWYVPRRPPKCTSFSPFCSSR